MYGVPQTSADTYNYYTYYDLYVTADDVKTSETISKLLKSALEKAKERWEKIYNRREKDRRKI